MFKRIATASIVLTLVAAGAAFAATHSAHAKVTLHATSLGKVLATSKGMTLYLYTPDGKNKSVCTGSCAQAWPPLMTKGKPVAAMGVNKSLLGTTKRANGKLQVTYNGHPLYTYVADTKPGDVAGEGVGGIWFVVNASGNQG